MYFISITRLRLRSVWFLPGFMLGNERSVKELIKTPGFIAGKELVDKKLTFWTITVWEADAAMKVFRNAKAHQAAMRKLPLWCNEASFAHWLDESNDVPDWNTAYSRMIATGKLAKVNKPSPSQANKNFTKPNALSKVQRIFKTKLPGELISH